MDTTVLDIREPTHDVLKHKSEGNWTTLVLLLLKLLLCGIFLDPMWGALERQQASAKHLGIRPGRQDRAGAAGFPGPSHCCVCRMTFPHLQPDFNAAPVLFLHICLAHTGPEDVSVLWASGRSDCACKTSHSASLCTRLCAQTAGRAGEGSFKNELCL